MIEAHKRRNGGSTRRASRVYLTDADIGKASGAPKVTIPIDRTAHMNAELGSQHQV